MSDDTPTERYNTNGDDAPTKRFPAQPPAQQPAPPVNPQADAATELFTTPDRARAQVPPTASAYRPAAAPGASSTQPLPPTAQKKSRAPLITLIVVGALIIIAGAIVITLLLNGNSSTPSATETTSAPPVSQTPDETPTEADTPTAPAVPEETEPPAPAPAPTGAVFTGFTPVDGSIVNCPDAFSTAPLVFTWSSNGAQLAWIGVDTNNAKRDPHAEVDTTATYRDLGFDCSRESQVFTVTLDDGTGKLTSETVTLQRELD